MSCRTNRRGFLKNAALGTAGCWILQNSDSAWSYQANEKLNIALVGVGNFGKIYHIPMVARINHNLVALCDVNLEQMESVANLPSDVRKYQDFRKLFDEMDRQIDAVIVATTHQNQPAITAAAMKRGKHVYSEKPL